MLRTKDLVNFSWLSSEVAFWTQHTGRFVICNYWFNYF